MNKPKCQFDKRRNCMGFCFCSPSPVYKAPTNQAVKGDCKSCTLPLTAQIWAVLHTKATGSKSAPSTAHHRANDCSPEQKKFLSAFAEEYRRCVARRVGATRQTKKPIASKGVCAAARGMGFSQPPPRTPCDSAFLPCAHPSITDGHCIPKGRKVEVTLNLKLKGDSL